MRTVARVLLYDVLLGSLYILSDCWLAWHYIQRGDYWWAALTLAAVALPGTLEALAYTWAYLGNSH